MTPPNPIEAILASVPPEDVTLGQLFVVLQALHNQIGVQSAVIGRMEQDLAAYKTAQKADLEDIVAEWQAAGRLGRFLGLSFKFIASAGAALAVLWTALKGLGHLFPGAFK